MYSIPVKFKINDTIYSIGHYNWDRERRCYTNYKVVTNKVRSIAISCNSKEEWKISYRVQEYRDGKTVDYGFNFSEADIGTDVFLTVEEAEAKIKELRKNL